MFIPELNTEWGVIKESVFEVSGENYSDINWNKLESYSDIERELSKSINNKLMDIIWELTTISEIEKLFKKSISKLDIHILNFRLELENDSIRFDSKKYIYGWVHYKEDNKIKTFRFKIDLKGKFSKC